MSLHKNGSWEDIDFRLGELRDKVTVRPHFSNYSKEEWDEIFDEIGRLHEDFKSVRYPQKDDRQDAWERFCSYRNAAYEARRDQFAYISKEHFRELEELSEDLMLPLFATTIADLFSEMPELIQLMKENGRKLSGCFNHYNKVKHEMIKDDRDSIRERLNDIKEDHDAFWGRVSIIYEDRQRAYEDKKADKRDRVEANLEKNKEKLKNAESALERFDVQKENLGSLIENAYSQSFKERHEGFLAELEVKIDSVKEQIKLLEEWIKEDEYTLRNL